MRMEQDRSGYRRRPAQVEAPVTGAGPARRLRASAPRLFTAVDCACHVRITRRLTSAEAPAGELLRSSLSKVAGAHGRRPVLAEAAVYTDDASRARLGIRQCWFVVESFKTCFRLVDIPFCPRKIRSMSRRQDALMTNWPAPCPFAVLLRAEEPSKDACAEKRLGELPAALNAQTIKAAGAQRVQL